MRTICIVEQLQNTSYQKKISLAAVLRIARMRLVQCNKQRCSQLDCIAIQQRTGKCNGKQKALTLGRTDHFSNDYRNGCGVMGLENCMLPVQFRFPATVGLTSSCRLLSTCFPPVTLTS